MFRKTAIKINKELCTGCGICTRKCRRNVLQLVCSEGKISAWCARPSQCSGCGKCVLVCTERAISLTERATHQLSTQE
ncbi:MAG: 4Fe-4S binding protein [Candidatus Azobacteroides sp.]|nr:4Fe-4S binding protein [Candidatus Azobacteroides sp.]